MVFGKGKGKGFSVDRIRRYYFGSGVGRIEVLRGNERFYSNKENYNSDILIYFIRKKVLLIKENGL